MLVLSRNLGERIIIDNGRIVVTVCAFGRNKSGKLKVRLGIKAPPEVTIDREEIDDMKRLQTNNEVVIGYGPLVDERADQLTAEGTEFVIRECDDDLIVGPRYLGTEENDMGDDA